MNNEQCKNCGITGSTVVHKGGTHECVVCNAIDGRATPAASPATAAGTIDTPEFRELASKYRSSVSFNRAEWQEKLVAHIDQHTAAAVAYKQQVIDLLQRQYAELETALAAEHAELSKLRQAQAPIAYIEQSSLDRLRDPEGTAIAWAAPGEGRVAVGLVGAQAQAPVSGEAAADQVAQMMELYAANYDMMSRINDDSKVYCANVSHDIRQNMIPATRKIIAAAAPVSAAPTAGDDERAKFEAWVREGEEPEYAFLILKRDKYSGGYPSTAVASAWGGWQARAALPQSAGAPVSEAETVQQIQAALLHSDPWYGAVIPPVSEAEQAGAVQNEENSPQTRMDSQSKPLLDGPADGQELPALPGHQAEFRGDRLFDLYALRQYARDALATCTEEARREAAARIAHLTHERDLARRAVLVALRKLHAAQPVAEAAAQTDGNGDTLADYDKILRGSVPECWKDCTSPIGAVQSYIVELEQRLAQYEPDWANNEFNMGERNPHGLPSGSTPMIDASIADVQAAVTAARGGNNNKDGKEPVAK